MQSMFIVVVLLNLYIDILCCNCDICKIYMNTLQGDAMVTRPSTSIVWTTWNKRVWFTTWKNFNHLRWRSVAKSNKMHKYIKIFLINNSASNRNPDSKLHCPHFVPTWILSAPRWTNLGPKYFAIWEAKVINRYPWLLYPVHVLLPQETGVANQPGFATIWRKTISMGKT